MANKVVTEIYKQVEILSVFPSSGYLYMGLENNEEI